MRKGFGAALCAALVGGLALAAISSGTATRTSHSSLDGADVRAAAQRATDTYRGKFKQAGPQAKIKIKAKVKDGEVKAIKSMTYNRLPANCEMTPAPATIGGSWTFRGGIQVNAQRKFKVIGNDGRPNPSSLRFSGKFSRSFNKVKGKFQTTSYFPPNDPPEETCSSFPKRYAAKG